MSFWEIFVIGVIALIVLGPERLPKAVRTVGLWVGKAKQGFNSIKTEIDRELKIQEIQQQIKAQKENLENEMGVESLRESLHDTQQDMHKVIDQVSHPLETPSTPENSETPSLTEQNDKPTSKE